MSDARLVCWFCGKTKDQVRNLIAGDRVLICEEDVARAELEHRSAAANERCSFCEKTEVDWLYAVGSVAICNRCVKDSRDVISEVRLLEAGRPPGAKLDVMPKEPVEGARCPSCRAVLAESARSQFVDVPGDGDATAQVLFLYCSNCGHTLDDVILPSE